MYSKPLKTSFFFPVLVALTPPTRLVSIWQGQGTVDGVNDGGALASRPMGQHGLTFCDRAAVTVVCLISSGMLRMGLKLPDVNADMMNSCTTQSHSSPAAFAARTDAWALRSRTRTQMQQHHTFSAFAYSGSVDAALARQMGGAGASSITAKRRCKSRRGSFFGACRCGACHGACTATTCTAFLLPKAACIFIRC